MSAPTLRANWIEELAVLPEGWDSYGGKRIADKALNALASFAVVPRSNGGIQLEAHQCGIDFELCISPDGIIEAFYWQKCEPESASPTVRPVGGGA